MPEITRNIPEDMLPIAEQAILNFALKGGMILVNGADITDSLLSQSAQINQRFDARVKVVGPKRTPQASKSKPQKPGPKA